jgi:hypothetical protein
MKQQELNRKISANDTRYEKVFHNMELLGIQDVTTNKQHRNGTVVWQLPIKCGKDKFIEVASFATGYVRNQNGGYTNYQLNKRCQSEPEYFKLSNGDYRKFETRGCKLIPIEIDRLEYLISYCLKNYFIKRANEVADGKLIPKWTHEWKLEQAGSYKEEYKNRASEVNELQEKLDAMTEDRDCKNDRIHDLENKLNNAISPTKHECAMARIKDLEDKLAAIHWHAQRIADHE